VSTLAFMPVGIAAVLWWLLWRVNRDRRWFSVGELVFWDVILLILVQLVWLRWF
jgi:hypothetical protein